MPLLDRARSDVADDRTGGGEESLHRRTVRAVSNAVWGRARNKNSSMRDEPHANSLYACLRGDVDGRSLNCFGAALLVVVGMNALGFRGSTLRLSEDHAYKSHPNGGARATCEVAVSGNTMAARAKRGREISRTFEDSSAKRGGPSNNITAEMSWLYMAKNPVLCDNPRMVMAAMIPNLNCDVDGQRSGADGAGKP